jgi:hypothetical protein
VSTQRATCVAINAHPPGHDAEQGFVQLYVDQFGIGHVAAGGGEVPLYQIAAEGNSRQQQTAEVGEGRLHMAELA